MDLLNDAAIISINGDEFVGLEGEEFVRTVSSQLNMDANAVQRLYYHYMGGNETLKSSILAVPHILNKGEIMQPWRKGHNKRMQTGIMAAPISIGGVWYLCCVVSTKNAQKKTVPYSIRLFDRSKIEEMIGSNIVHDGTEATSQPSDTSNSNPLTVAKVLQKYLLANYSQENNENDNNNLRTENKQYNNRRNMKKTIRLTESDLQRLVRKIIIEAYGDENEDIFNHLIGFYNYLLSTTRCLSAVKTYYSLNEQQNGAIQYMLSELNKLKQQSENLFTAFDFSNWRNVVDNE